MTSRHEEHLREAIRLARENAAGGGRPFGAVLVRGDDVVGTGVNEVVASHDITAHAELQAIRAACRGLASADLSGSVVYASGHPCPMCLAALITARVDAVYYAFDNDDGEPYGLSSARTYEALAITPSSARIRREKLDVGVTAEEVYGAWHRSQR